MLSRQKIYQFLVNRQTGISERYHKMHDGTNGIRKIFSWCYLLWLNFAFYILFCRFLGEKKEAEIYEQKRLDLSHPESARSGSLSADDFVEKLKQYDVISFDIFDTLIFRPFSEPTDLFYILGMEVGNLNFHDLRIAKEWECRQAAYRKNGSYEVTLSDIWKRMEEDIGIPASEGIALEEKLELSLCYANPFMKEVFLQLEKLGKRLMVISDMYLSQEMLTNLLRRNGYGHFEKIYVSCEYGKNKGNGLLFEIAKRNFSEETKIIHVGDNETSDVKMARKAGFAALHYPNVNRMSLSYRPYDMSVIIGGAYRGIVNNYLYCGKMFQKQDYPYTFAYEYGFIYGGLFVLGYCNFIHDYCVKNGIDKILFLSRDGDILKQVYDFLFPGDTTEYVYWSRMAATKLEFWFDRYDFFRRFLYHKVNQEIPMKKIFSSMELTELLDGMETYEDIDEEEKKTKIRVTSETLLTDQNVQTVKRYLCTKTERISSIYKEQELAAKKYFEHILGDSKKAVAVDIGWAGSGAMVLSHLIEKEWRLGCTLNGIVAGTNTASNYEPNASESYLQNGKLVSYLYSQRMNREIWKKHDPNKGYNIFWELLLSSPAPNFIGFYQGNTSLEKDVYIEDIGISLRFGRTDDNQTGICEIQRGILDFVQLYTGHFKDYPYMMTISGRDAYAPMLVAAGYGERYLKTIERLFSLEVNVS